LVRQFYPDFLEMHNNLSTFLHVSLGISGLVAYMVSSRYHDGGGGNSAGTRLYAGFQDGGMVRQARAREEKIFCPGRPAQASG